MQDETMAATNEWKRGSAAQAGRCVGGEEGGDWADQEAVGGDGESELCEESGSKNKNKNENENENEKSRRQTKTWRRLRVLSEKGLGNRCFSVCQYVQVQYSFLTTCVDIYSTYLPTVRCFPVIPLYSFDSL